MAAAAAYFETVQKIYIAFYQRPADPAGLRYWAEQINAAGGNPNAVITAFGTSPEATALYGAVTAETIGNVIEAIYQAAFNRPADAAGKAYWTAAFNAGTITASSIALAVVQGATGGDDAIAIANKLQVANEFTQQVDGRALTDTTFGQGSSSSFNATYAGDADAQAARDILKTVTANPATVLSSSQVTEQIQNKIADAGDPIKGQTGGKTYMLTKGLDNIPGTAGNDTIIGAVDAGNAELNTLSALDIINGGAGVDTLKVATNAATNIPLSNLSNVEIIEVQGAAAGGTTVDTTTLTGVTNLNITKTAGAINADAGATTDVSVALATAAATVVDGGNNINVALTDVVTASTVAVGAATAAKGDVVVSMTGKASTAGTDATLATVAVTGGKTISVTQVATSNAAAAAADTTGATITQGAVTIVGDAATTEVTVKQDASVDEVVAVTAVAAKAATQDVTFAAMTAGQTVAVNFGAGVLTFTANKDLTAAEAASAFANLAKDAKQGNASASLGIYTDATGGVTDGWTSGAVQTVSATQAKVTFTSATAAAAITDGLGTVASVPGAYSGNAVAAVAAKAGVLGVANGAVAVTDGANSIKTITVDGYAASTTTATTVLETLNLSNSGLTYVAGKVTAAAGITVADTAATLALNLEKVGFSGYYNGDSAVTTQAGAVTLTLAPTTLNVKSTGNNYVNLTAALTETLNVSGTGLLDASTTDLAALKTVKVTETAGLSLNAAVNDTVESVDTTGTTGTVTVTINGDKATYTGGAGVDNVSVANAATAISKAIDLGAGNDRLDLSAALAIDPTVELKGGDGTDTIVLSAAAAVARTAGVTFQDKITSFERLEVGAVGANSTVNLDNLDDINYVVTNGTGGDFGLVLDKMLTGATVQLNGDHSVSATQAGVEVKLADATGGSDVVNLITNAATTTNIGTVKAAGVETINITANDTDITATAAGKANVSTNTLTLNADKAATINVTGEGNLTLNLAATSTAVTLIDGSTASGVLTIGTVASDLAATTVKGGSAADVLTAHGANDVLIGGAGNDVLKVNGGVASAVTLTGGDGVDQFDVSTFLAANAGAAATITDFTKGETIKFASNVNANFASSKVTLIAEATFDNYVTEAAKAADLVSGGTHGIAWFQFGGNTFIVQDIDGDAAFTNGADSIVKLTGLVDLSASSFNEVGQGTLLYI